MIIAHQWLASVPDHLTLYAILGNVSDAKPVAAYFEKTNQINLTALWQDTPYANWFEAMPYIAPLSRTSPFLDWVDSAPSQDWGWLAASPFDTDTIRLQLKSLTKVLMPNDAEVFFRYWDGRYLYPILNSLQTGAAQVIPVFSHYLINKQTIEVPITHNQPEVKDFPWWRVEPQLIKQLTEQNPTTLIDNLMKWLQEENSAIFYQYPEKNIRSKVTYFVENNDYTPETVANQLLDYLVQGRI